jgi:lipoprotein-releasing system permease protein
MALVVVLAVMTGFDEELRSKILGNRSHLTVERTGGIRDYPALVSQLESDPDVVAAAPFVQGMALLRSDRGRTTGAAVLGIKPELQRQVTELDGSLGRGSFEPGGIVLGSVLAQSIGVFDTGGSVTVVTARKYDAFFGSVQANKRMKVTGIFHSGYYEFDSQFAMITLADGQRLFGARGAVSGVQVKLTNPIEAHEVKRRLADSLDYGYRLTTWIEMNRSFFSALKTEKVVMFVILMFIVLVAAFNIVSTLIMVVMEKTRDIGILRTVGTPSRSIMMVFMIEGLVTGLVGTLSGLIGGVLFARYLNGIAGIIEWLTGWTLFPADMYVFDQIPVKIVPVDLVWIVAGAILLSFAATVYPAWQASRLDPVESLRHE